MNVGFFTKKEDGSLFGHLPTLNFTDVSIERIAKKGRGPDFTVTVEGAELGSAWDQTSKSGRAYMSVKVVIPGRDPVRLAIFQTQTADQFVAVYSEPSTPKAEQPATDDNIAL